MKPNHVAGDPESKVLPIAQVKKSWNAAEIKPLCKAAGVEYTEGDEKNVVLFRATTEAVDREDDIIKADGGDFTDFMSNPVFLWAHDYESIPLGAVLKIEIDRSNPSKLGLLMTVLFQTVTDEAKELCELTKLGFIKAVSIGFRAKRGGLKIPNEAERQALGMGPYGAIFLSWTMYELSLCPIGMNQEALKVRSWGKKTIALLKGENPSNIVEEEEINVKPEDIAKAIKDGIAASLPDFLKGMDFTLLTIKVGDHVTGDHIKAMHNAHAGFSKALTHMAAVLQEHPIVPDDSGSRGPQMSDKCSKSLNNAIAQGTKAIIHARSVSAAHETEEDPKEPAAKDDKGDKSLLAFAMSRPSIVGEVEKSPLDALNERFNR